MLLNNVINIGRLTYANQHLVLHQNDFSNMTGVMTAGHIWAKQHVSARVSGENRGRTHGGMDERHHDLRNSHQFGMIHTLCLEGKCS